MDTQLQGDFLIVLTFKVGKQKWDLHWASFLIFPYLPTVPIRAPNSFNNIKASKNFLSLLVVGMPWKSCKEFWKCPALNFFFPSHIQHWNKILKNKKLGQFLCSVTPLRVGEFCM